MHTPKYSNTHRHPWARLRSWTQVLHPLLASTHTIHFLTPAQYADMCRANTSPAFCLGYATLTQHKWYSKVLVTENTPPLRVSTMRTFNWLKYKLPNAFLPMLSSSSLPHHVSFCDFKMFMNLNLVHFNKLCQITTTIGFNSIHPIGIARIHTKVVGETVTKLVAGH